jgi:hypothetical protein
MPQREQTEYVFDGTANWGRERRGAADTRDEGTYIHTLRMEIFNVERMIEYR